MVDKRAQKRAAKDRKRKERKKRAPSTGDGLGSAGGALSGMRRGLRRVGGGGKGKKSSRWVDLLLISAAAVATAFFVANRCA